MPKKSILKSATYLALYCCLMFIGTCHANLHVQEVEPQVLRGQWFYHWGDLPKNDTSGNWQFSQGDWHQIEFPENLPNRNQHNIVWVKINLPAGSWRDPYLFLSSVDLTFETFHNGIRIHHFGDIDAHGQSDFEGWPWHIIRLPNNYADHTLYFRIASDYPYIGLSGQASIGNRFTLLNDIYKNGLTGLSFILIILLIGIISTTMGIIKKDKMVAFSTGILSFNLALMMFAENELSQVVLFEPLVWRYIAAFSYFMVPAFLSIIILAWFKKSPPRIPRAVLAITLLFTCGVAVLSLFTSFNFVNAYPYFDVLFIVLVSALLAGCIQNFYKEGATGSLMLIGILALFVSLILDMLSAHGLITWIGQTGKWGLLLFTITSLVIYLVRDWHQQVALKTLTEELESKVNMRTAELKASQHELQKLAREDYLTKLLNRRAFTEGAIAEVANAIRHHRPISLLLFDLDHFKDVNDIYGHAVGDIVLKEVASISKDTCRNGEMVCRYGGEEFVILLHAADAQQAEQFVTRLHVALKEINILAEGNTIHVTASFGLISINCSKNTKDKPERIVDRLLAEADKMMYQVKVSGRDGIKTLEMNLDEL